MNCESCNKIKHTCHPKQYAACTFYETSLPEWSELKDESCVVLEETTKELYDSVSDIKDLLNLDWVDNSCIDITKVDGKVNMTNFLKSVYSTLKELKCDPESSANLKKIDLDITEYGLDYKCLSDSCTAVDPNKLSILLQKLIDYSCEEQVPQLLIGAGEVSLTEYITHLQSTTVTSVTLKPGREGQKKFIKVTSFGGNITLSVPSLQNGSAILFNNLGDFVHLLFTDGEWSVLTNSGCIIT